MAIYLFNEIALIATKFKYYANWKDASLQTSF